MRCNFSSAQLMSPQRTRPFSQQIYLQLINAVVSQLFQQSRSRHHDSFKLHVVVTCYYSFRFSLNYVLAASCREEQCCASSSSSSSCTCRNRPVAPSDYI